MHRTVTVGDIFLVLGVFVGLAGTGGGLLAIFAGGMSDAPEAGASAGRTGCIILAVSATLLVGCIVSLLRG